MIWGDYFTAYTPDTCYFLFDGKLFPSVFIKRYGIWDNCLVTWIYLREVSISRQLWYLGDGMKVKKTSIEILIWKYWVKSLVVIELCFPVLRFHEEYACRAEEWYRHYEQNWNKPYKKALIKRKENSNKTKQITLPPEKKPSKRLKTCSCWKIIKYIEIKTTMRYSYIYSNEYIKLKIH